MALKNLLLILIIVFSSQVAVAKEGGTVFSVKGKVWISKDNSAWSTLTIGKKVFFGESIRSDKDSQAGILNPDGSMMRIAASSKVVYGPGKKMEKSSGFFAVLSELFSSRIRSRIGGARGEKDEVTCPEQAEWIKVLKEDKIETSSLEDVFKMAHDFDQCGKTIKTAGLVSKLSESFPDNSGFKNLAQNAISKANKKVGFTLKSGLNVFVMTDEKKQFMGKSQNQITRGSKFKIHYHADKESYIYLFLTDTKKQETSLVFPENILAVKGQGKAINFTSFVEPGRKGIIIPQQGWSGFEPVSDKKILWGWSCISPLSPMTINNAKTILEEKIKRKDSNFSLADQMPELCLDHFSQVYSL